MGDHVRIRLPEAALNFGMYPATQVDSAFYPPWDGKMSTSQRAVMLCGWGVKAGMACLQVTQCVAIAERFGKCCRYLKVFYKCPGLLLLTYLLKGTFEGASAGHCNSLRIESNRNGSSSNRSSSSSIR